MPACTIVSRCLFIFNFCLIPVPLSWARWGGGASRSATGGSGGNLVSIIKTPLYPFIAASVYPRLSPAHLGSQPHAAPVPGPHDNPSLGRPGLPGPRPAARRAGRTSGGHTCPAPLRTGLQVGPVRGRVRASRLVARPVTLRPETLPAGPPRPPRRSTRARAEARRSP